MRKEYNLYGTCNIKSFIKVFFLSKSKCYCTAGLSLILERSSNLLFWHLFHIYVQEKRRERV